MAITFPSSTITTRGLRTSTTVTLPTGLSAGDYTVIALYVESVTTETDITTPSGYTDFSPRQVQHTPGNNFRLYVAYRKWQSGDTNPTWGHSSNSWYSQGMALRVAGANGTTFLDPSSPSTAQGTATTTHGVSGGITTAFNNSGLVLVIVPWDDATTYSTWSSPLSELQDSSSAFAGGVQASAGASGGKTATASISTDYVSYLIGIKEEAAATGGYVPRHWMRRGGLYVPFSRYGSGAARVRRV